MRQLRTTSSYDLWMGQLKRPYAFSAPFDGSDFALLLVVVDGEITNDERNSLSAAIIEQGCRYAVCTGHDCSLWDDAIDWAYLAASPDYAPSSERLVHTTWHENEPLSDVVHFFRYCTEFDNFVAKHFLALILGGDGSTADAVTSSLGEFFPLVGADGANRPRNR